MTAQIGLFAKHWTPGHTKTRLASTVGNELAAACSKELLKTTLLRLSATDATVTDATAIDARVTEANVTDGNVTEANVTSRMLALTPIEQQIAFEELVSELSLCWQLSPQPAGDLGAKMTWFFQQAFASGHESAMLLGSDSPDFPIAAVEKGLKWLSSPQSHGDGKLVLGPATDGGYWCVGATGAVPPIFDQMPWSQPNLMEASLKELHAIGWQEGTDYLLLDEWYDVDREVDLKALQSRIREKSITDKNDPLAKLNQWIERSITLD